MLFDVLLIKLECKIYLKTCKLFFLLHYCATYSPVNTVLLGNVFYRQHQKLNAFVTLTKFLHGAVIAL